MTDKKSNESRRKLLKSIAAGSGAILASNGLPDSWSRPVVDSVMLPAHASTSNAVYYSDNVQVVGTRRETNEESLFVRLANNLVSDASAQRLPPIGCARVVGSMLVIEILDYAGYRFSGQLPLNKQTVDVDLECCTECDSVTPMAIVSINGDEVVIETEEPVYTIPIAQNCGPVPPLECIGGSDRNIKANFAPVDEQEILKKVANLPIETWNYTDRDTGVRHIGPMAQDFYKSFSVGNSDKTINMVDANGVNLAAIKALNTKLEEKDAQIKVLEEKLVKVMKKLENLS